MLSCEQAAELVSQSLDRKLPWRTRLALRLHLMMCFVCSRYKRQIEGLDQLIVTHRERNFATGAPSRIELSAQRREQIKAMLHRQAG